jgi:hypothetical protein
MVWSTDRWLERCLRVFYESVPVIAKEYGAVVDRIDLGKREFNIRFPEDITEEQKVACYNKVEHLLRSYGITTH